jgi:segregation and condensation protein B
VNEEALAVGNEMTPEEMIPSADTAMDIVEPTPAESEAAETEIVTDEAEAATEMEPAVETEVVAEAAEAVTEAAEAEMAEVYKTPGVDQMMRKKVEAVLFVTDKALHAQAIARIINVDVQLVRQAILELIEQYESRETALEIVQDNGYVIEVKPEFASIMQEFLPLDIPTSLLRTLSAIAIRAPVAQSEIVQMRGASAYDHIKDLVERDLIHKKEEGRSPILSTTKKFQQYFRLSSDGSELRKYVKQQERLLAAQAEERRKREEEAMALAAGGEGAAAGEDGAQLKLPVSSRASIPEGPIIQIQRETPRRTQNKEAAETEASADATEAPAAETELQDFTPDDSGSLTD